MPRRCIHVLGLSTLLVAMTADAVAPDAVSDDPHRRRVQRAAETALNLRTCSVEHLALPTLSVDVDAMVLTVPTPVGSAVPAMTMRLTRSSVRAPGFEVLAQDDDGVWTAHDPGPVRTYRGTVDQDASMIAAMTFDEHGMTGSIHTGDGAQFYVQPARIVSRAANAGEHIIYHADDILTEPVACAADETMRIAPAHIMDGPALPGGGGGSVACTEIAIDADHEYYIDYGSVAAVQSRIESIINTINVQYERDVGISHEITTILVRSSSSDPYTSSDAGTLLNEMRSEWNANQTGISRDVAHLFTGRDLNAPTIGIAWIGVICSSVNGGYGYGLSESDFNSNFGCATDLTAHELGHNWNASHCSCTSNTMNPSIACANTFSAATISTITAFRDSRSCLSACEGSETGTTTLPFDDDFDSGSVDGELWTGNQGTVVSTDGANEPSGSYALNISGSTEIRSAVIDLSDESAVTVRYEWQRTGYGNSPETGEDLVVEYFSASNAWVELESYAGSGADQTAFTAHGLQLPAGALHDGFRLRFRSADGTSDLDDWFVDDVRIIAGVIADTCPWDCAPSGGDDAVNVTDVIMLVSAFGDGNGPCDLSPVNDDGSRGNGVVNIDDLIEMIENFGACP